MGMAVCAALVLLAVVFTEAYAHPLTFYKNPLETRPDPTVLNVVCPDNTKECPDGNTCCPQGSGNFGCCPKLHGVCCADKKHCCPAKYTCGTQNAECIKADSPFHPSIELTTPSTRDRERERVRRMGFLTNPLWGLVDQQGTEQFAKEEVGDHVCPDKSDVCPDSDTCCPIADGKEGCCPHLHAVCCADKEHCCPQGYSCSGGKCTQGDLLHPLVAIAGPLWELVDRQGTEQFAKKEVGDHACPDKSDVCPDSDTCCPIADGKEGCCPHLHAVCCADKEHCCPQGYSCSGGKCTQGDLLHPLVAIAGKLEPHVTCPDQHSECPTGDTCCPVGDSKYGCCPKANAVCCSDQKHCCPEGYSCKSGKCEREGSHHPLVELAMRNQGVGQLVENIICPDQKHECPSGDTCCPVDSGFACCPMVDAVCCTNGTFCCPKGYTCDPSTNKCHGESSRRSTVKLLASKLKTQQPNAQAVNCTDGSMCPTGDTCCPVGSNKYGCCPKANAVCCADQKHCCPEGYSCVSTGKCEREGSHHPLVELAIRNQDVGQLVENIICPDKKHECPSNDTCCLNGAESYGCCAEPNAVCCSDEKHCCPNGYACNSGVCTERTTLPLVELDDGAGKLPGSPMFLCPDGVHQCQGPDDSTCCPLQTGEYSCCPSPNANCCPDFKSCCPEGYKCAGDSCDGVLNWIPFLKMTGST